MPHLIVRTRGFLLLAAVLAALLPLAAVTPAQATPKPKPKVVYLTFDDGPNAQNSPRLLKLLARQRVPATFFVVGQWLAMDPEHATRLWLSGHAIGNHTWSHPDLTFLSPAAIQHQLAATARLIGPGAGACMRPPYGATNATVAAVTHGLGLKQVMWTVDPQDWVHQDTGYIVDHVATHVRHRSIVLLHDGGGDRSATIAAVKQLIPLLRMRGFEFRTVPACRVPLGGEVLGAAKPDRPSKKPVDPQPTPPVPEPTPPVPSAGMDP